METKVKIEVGINGQKKITVFNENLTSEDKLRLKYSIYKEINEPYKRLMNFLDKEA